jgi:hypothetical protein
MVFATVRVHWRGGRCDQPKIRYHERAFPSLGCEPEFWQEKTKLFPLCRIFKFAVTAEHFGTLPKKKSADAPFVPPIEPLLCVGLRYLNMPRLRLFCHATTYIRGMHSCDRNPSVLAASMSRTKRSKTVFVER